MEKFKKPLKNKCGVYQFLNKYNEIIYVGSSKNLYERMRTYERTKNNLKNSLIKKWTYDVIYIYTDEFKELELELIKKHQPTYNKKDIENKENYLKKNTKYINVLPVLKGLKNADIAIIPTKKGTGKTTQFIREALISYEKNHLPSFYIRTTSEQIEEFIRDGKFGELLNVLGFINNRKIKLTKKGLFNLHYDKKLKKYINEPIIYFLAINEAMKIQSSKFKTANYAIFDEIQNHFLSSNLNIFNKFLNLISSTLREENTKIIILFNKINNSDLFLQKFKIDKQIQKIKKGNIKRFNRVLGKSESGEVISIKICLYNPAESKKWLDSQKASIAYKLSFLSEYGKVINTNEFFIEIKDIQFIKKLGDFEGIINFNGHKIGLWNSKNGNFQFSDKYNKNGKIYFLNIGEFSQKANLLRNDFLLKLKNKLLLKECEFSNTIIFNLIVEMLKNINLYKN